MHFFSIVIFITRAHSLITAAVRYCYDNSVRSFVRHMLVLCENCMLDVGLSSKLFHHQIASSF